MSVASSLVLFAVIWFMALFDVLPLRLKTQGDVGKVAPGTPAGARVAPPKLETPCGQYFHYQI